MRNSTAMLDKNMTKAEWIQWMDSNGERESGIVAAVFVNFMLVKMFNE